MGEPASVIGTCPVCHTINTELKPYGKDGSLICFHCAAKPEHKAEAEKHIHKHLKTPGHAQE